jgi:hypothetical protein
MLIRGDTIITNIWNQLTPWTLDYTVMQGRQPKKIHNTTQVMFQGVCLRGVSSSAPILVSTDTPLSILHSSFGSNPESVRIFSAWCTRSLTRTVCDRGVLYHQCICYSPPIVRLPITVTPHRLVLVISTRLVRSISQY